MSVEIYRIMHNDKLPSIKNEPVKWIADFLDKKNDMDWWVKNVMSRSDWGALYLTAKRMVYKFSDQIINEMVNLNNNQSNQ